MAREEPTDRPPFFKTWRGAYSFVLAWLVVMLLTFAFITWVYE